MIDELDECLTEWAWLDYAFQIGRDIDYWRQLDR